MTQVDYYLTLASPYAYMGHTRFVDISKKMKASVAIKPVNMGDIFSKTGGLPLGKRSPARQAYRFQELERWRQHLDIPLILKPKFLQIEFNTHQLLRSITLQDYKKLLKMYVDS